MKFWFLALICIALTIVLVVFELKRKMWLALLFKALSSCAFVLLGAMSFSLAADRSGALLLFIGLLLGAIGDVLLNLCHVVNESKRVFFLGGLAFFPATSSISSSSSRRRRDGSSPQ